MYGVIDIGSNSVRLMLHDGVKTLSKEVKTTRLGEGVALNNMLSKSAIERTVRAVAMFVANAREKGVDALMIFATEAVRRAGNGKVFVEEVFARTGIAVRVLTGDEEARVGFIGAGGDGAVLDIGGASTEIIVGRENNIEYSKSVGIGAVVLRDVCGEDEDKLLQFISEKYVEYGTLPSVDVLTVIGGAVTCVAAMLEELEVYDPAIVHGRVMVRTEIDELYNRLRRLSLQERYDVKGLSVARADIIVGAMYELLFIMGKLGVEKCTVSEEDNLEGYLKCVLAGKI